MKHPERPLQVFEVGGLSHFVWGCSDIDVIWEELELVRCPFCGATADQDGKVKHNDPRATWIQ